MLPALSPRPARLLRIASRLPGGPVAGAMVAVARDAGARPLAVLFPDDPGLSGIVLHEPLPPEGQAALLEALNRRFAGPRSPVLPLSPRGWAIWSRGDRGRGLAATPPAWGEAPPLPGPQDDEAARRRTLRLASALTWGAAPRALDARDGEALGRSTERARDLLAGCASPRSFPPIPAPDAPRDRRLAAHLGVVYAAFGAQAAADPGEPLSGEAERAPRSLEPLLAALAGPLADLVPQVGPPLRSLYLLPGPLGTRLAWQLCAVVPDDAPLLEAARLAERLGQHLRLGGVGVAMMATGPLVLSRAALAGMLRLRLFARPLRRLSIRLGARCLLGEPGLDGLGEGPDFTPEDAQLEAAALLEATAACWAPRARASEAEDLLFGAWPALAWVAGGEDPRASMGTIHGELVRSSDPARARVGAAGGKVGWGIAPSPDRARPTDLLRTWGPTLVRMQERSLEVLP